MLKYIAYLQNNLSVHLKKPHYRTTLVYKRAFQEEARQLLLGLNLVTPIYSTTMYVAGNEMLRRVSYGNNANLAQAMKIAN